MKRILVLIAFLLWVPAALAQPVSVLNPGAANDVCVTEGLACPISVDAKGQLFTSSGAAAGIYAEDTGHTTGDSGTFMLGVRHDLSGALCNAVGDYCPVGVDAQGRINIAGGYAEDAVHVNTDYGIFILGKQTHTLAPSANDGDYSALNIDGNGKLYTLPIRSNLCLDVQLTITADNHAIGDIIGGKLTFSGASQSGATMTNLVSLAWADDEGFANNISVIWFDTDPTNSTLTDSGLITIHDDDLDDVTCVVPVTDHLSFVASSVSTAKDINCAWRATTTNSYAIVRADEAATYTVTDGLHLKACFERD